MSLSYKALFLDLSLQDSELFTASLIGIEIGGGHHRSDHGQTQPGIF
ncbi:hypothetical protein [Hahella sp. KA22]|nr:hypothetical protein [Hahella sp. KA22]